LGAPSHNAAAAINLGSPMQDVEEVDEQGGSE
jgi:hypothetical protein